jgi:hypothetical protein
MEAGRSTAGSGRTGAPYRLSAVGAPLRLDPFSLPVRFEAADDAADERRRVVDLYHERVVLRRSVRGMRMALNLPLKTFRGVAIRLTGETAEFPTAMAVVLEHGDPALSLPLYCASESDDIVAEWECWGRVLGLPLLVTERDGSFREPFTRLGALRIEAPTWRRRRRSAIARRRPRNLRRRRLLKLSGAAMIHRGEREIIARD